MIGRLKGILIEKQPPQVLVDVNGVGYEVDASMNTFYKLPELNKEVVLFTHLVVREDAQQLFGFYDKPERSLFKTLIKVNGVGPKMALAILSGMEISEFVRCVQNNDTKGLVRLPGVGKKTAERLIIEMRDKLKDFQAAPGSLNELPDAAASEADSNQVIMDAESALIALGYRPQEASKAIAKIDVAALSSEEVIRLALKNMVN
ncbi:MAG: Holliday junction branch migration protein RuvA [Gammaproteobacteria bacterium]|nr:MAG: Holliday junction branch migration protein RuvA [Gammaproteobacteria bacterium]